MSISPLLAAPAAVHVAVAIGGYDIGSGRTVPTVAAVVGLVSVVIGGTALARSARPGGTGGRGVAATVTGLIGMIVGTLHAANAAGGLGTGNGLAGAVIASVLGLVGVVLGGLALARSRRGDRAVQR